MPILHRSWRQGMSYTCGVVVEAGGRACGKPASGAAMRRVKGRDCCESFRVWVSYCPKHERLLPIYASCKGADKGAK